MLFTEWRLTETFWGNKLNVHFSEHPIALNNNYLVYI